MASQDAEKLAQLREKYQQLKQANKVLKTGLLDKQEEYVKLEQQLKEKEATIRQQLEEIDHLQFQNGRISKQLGGVTAQLEEQKQQQQQRPSGWSVGGLISGKQQLEAIQKADDEIRILQDELAMKIQENEDLHMKVFEAHQQQEEEGQRLGTAEAEARSALGQRTEELEAERGQTRRLTAEAQERMRELERMAERLEESGAAVDSLRTRLEEERCTAEQQQRGLRRQLACVMPFDEAQHEPWALWNLGPRQGRSAQRRAQAVQQLHLSVADACRQSGGVLQLWGRTFGSGGDEESASRLQLRNKMYDTVQRLAGLVSEQLPELFGRTGPLVLQPTAAWRSSFQKTASMLLQVHRKWVLYQSLLLLHECNSAYAGRSPQELVQAQHFVDCLWRLHRCVKALFIRLRIFACLPALMTRSGSASHFAIARGALQRGEPPRGTCAAAGALEGQAPPPAADLLRGKLHEVLQCWEGIGRCLSSWATAQANLSEGGRSDGGSVVDLLEAVHRFCGCLAERVAPAVAQVAQHAAQPEALARGAEVRGVEALGAEVPAASSSSRGYLERAAARLQQAPNSIGFEESLQMRLLVQRLTENRGRLSAEVRQQMTRLQAVTDEKVALADELRSLQDSHALLCSNFGVLQESAKGRVEDTSPASGHAPALGHSEPRPTSGAAHGGGVDLVLSSRQRALLESLSVTAQESASLRQSGYFVDVVSLSAGEVALAQGAPPDVESSASWELAVRKVYEQQMRNVQAQIKAADGKAMEMHLNVQQHMDLIRNEEREKQALRNDVDYAKAQVDSVMDDMATTRKNYDTQLAMLTEHICALSVRLSEKDASLASLQAQKILCGHCGMWNPMGKLHGSEDVESEGSCQTCKEKILSRGT